VPALPPAILEPLWDQFAALLPHRDDAHPLGCHRPRIPDRIVFDKLIQVLVFGCGYRRIADHTCSATTLRRRRDEWITLGVAEQLRPLVLGAYDRLRTVVPPGRPGPWTRALARVPTGATGHPTAGGLTRIIHFR
jgi:transposase